MAKQTRRPRGPKCSVYGAVMSPKDEGGEPICWHAKNHAGILRARAAAANRGSETQQNKKK
jgi:hypothetical protein